MTQSIPLLVGVYMRMDLKEFGAEPQRSFVSKAKNSKFIYIKIVKHPLFVRYQARFQRKFH